MNTHRLGLLGGESTGKTTLALDLAHTLPGFIAYCHRLPTGAGTLWRRLRTVDRYPLDGS